MTAVDSTFSDRLESWYPESCLIAITYYIDIAGLESSKQTGFRIKSGMTIQGFHEYFRILKNV